MKRIVSLILVLICLFFAASALAAPRAGQKPSFGTENKVEEPKKDDNNPENPDQNPSAKIKTGIVKGRIRVYGWKDKVKNAADRFAPYAVLKDFPHVDDLYLEYMYSKMSSEERVWELYLVDKDGNLEYCDSSHIEIYLPYPSIWSKEQSLYWKWTQRYATKHYKWEYALGEILGYYYIDFGGYTYRKMIYNRSDYYRVRECAEFGTCVTLSNDTFGYGLAVFIRNTKR